MRKSEFIKLLQEIPEDLEIVFNYGELDYWYKLDDVSKTQYWENSDDMDTLPGKDVILIELGERGVHE